MNSKDRSSLKHSLPPRRPPRPALEEQTLKTDRIQIERKSFVFSLKQNPRGRFLRITEDVQGRRDQIIIPAPGLEDFRKIVEGMVRAAAEGMPESSGEEAKE
jgi:hypothetical protein